MTYFSQKLQYNHWKIKNVYDKIKMCNLINDQTCSDLTEHKAWSPLICWYMFHHVWWLLSGFLTCIPTAWRNVRESHLWWDSYLQPVDLESCTLLLDHGHSSTTPDQTRVPEMTDMVHLNYTNKVSKFPT